MNIVHLRRTMRYIFEIYDRGPVLKCTIMIVKIEINFNVQRRRYATRLDPKQKSRGHALLSMPVNAS
jgi:hypothetical protein